MVYLILAGLVLVLIVAVNLAKAEPMPESMEDERLDAQEQAQLQVRWWEVQAGYRPRAMGDSLGDRGGRA